MLKMFDLIKSFVDNLMLILSLILKFKLVKKFQQMYNVRTYGNILPT